MSIRSKPYYWLKCDEPDCNNISTEGSEFTAWEDPTQALDQAECSDWLIIGDKHYCDGHAAKHDPALKEDAE